MYQHIGANYHKPTLNSSLNGSDQQVFYKAKKTKARICSVQELATLLEKPQLTVQSPH